ncbi:MAG: nicotinamide riboside transporter PnuC [Bacteroidales bacterium]|nr:nicotinamide riboside transporter PnuC [Bacteroidales bacterium]
MDIFRILEIFSLVTGVIFMTLQVFQNRWMWYMEILTASAALAVSLHNHLWAVSLLNAYYIVMAVVGIFSWRKIEQDNDSDVHIVRMSPKILAIGLFLLVAGSFGLSLLLKATSDPAPVLDSVSFALAIVATWWLTRSHIEQWYLWFASDILSATLFFTQGLYWMGLQFTFYLAFSVIGYVHWKKKGTIVS